MDQSEGGGCAAGSVESNRKSCLNEQPTLVTTSELGSSGDDARILQSGPQNGNFSNSGKNRCSWPSLLMGGACSTKNQVNVWAQEGRKRFLVRKHQSSCSIW